MYIKNIHLPPSLSLSFSLHHSWSPAVLHSDTTILKLLMDLSTFLSPVGVQQFLCAVSWSLRLLPMQKSLAEREGSCLILFDQLARWAPPDVMPHYATLQSVRSVEIRSSILESSLCALKAPCSMPTSSALRHNKSIYALLSQCEPMWVMSERANMIKYMKIRFQVFFAMSC